ncbi:MAG TPA: transcriptional regulator, partial [Actinomycetospora sp.]
RYRVDWSEQRHHLGGRLGRGLLDLSLDRGWVRRRDTHRAVVVTDAGADAFAEHFGVTAGP